MKKLIFAGFAVLLAFALITCEAITQNENDGEELTNVEYSADGKSVTLYLEGGVPVSKATRALSTDRTKMGHDFYEVVFATGGTSPVIARASWEIGQSVSISNVGMGATYNAVGVPASATAGSAVLFVGRKSDMTLLAVGKISAVNGDTSSTALSAAFTIDTRSVTFTVAALQAGVADLTANIANSSFLTSNDATATGITTGNTDVVTIALGAKSFPMYRINIGETRAAAYSIGSAGTNAGPVMAGLVTNFADYIAGIRLDAAIGTANFQKRDPRYPAGGGLYSYTKDIDLDYTTVIAPLASSTTADAVANDPLPNPIQFTFNSTGAVKSIFSFYIDIPVYAITKGTYAGTPAAKIWSVKPAYETYTNDLDDGARGAGGCVLVGTGMTTFSPIQVITK